MNYCILKGIQCSLADINGYCPTTVCSKNAEMLVWKYPIGYVPNTTIVTSDKIVFPHTIGNITFYSSQELIKWVEYQQEVNKR